MELINCVIIDDDELDRFAVETCLEQYTFIKIEGSFSNPLDCLEIIQKKNVQLLFLDIDMPYISGIEFLNSFKNPPLCIFITSHPEYALKGFETHALDFILKPLRPERFERSVMRAREFLQIQSKAKLYDIRFADDFLIIKESYDLIKIKISDIIYLEALKDYTKIITPSKTYLTLSNLKNFFEKLPNARFLRIHRSFAVAISKIRKLEQNELLLDDFKLPVGKTFKNEISRVLLNTD
ncbi:MAG: LytTR family DNA-binding domain-containing protein [Bacteroidota bacterium]|nr:LytTR family DNA-binding domain-containing protein [Bacteroidota bacterium]